MARNLSRRVPSLAGCKFVLAVALLVWMGIGSGLAYAEPYAPLADYASVPGKDTNPLTQSLQNATVPDAKEVGVAPYPNARIVSMYDYAQVSGGRYQEIKALSLYTVDPLKQVTDYFKGKESGWVWRENQGDAGRLYPIEGASAPNNLRGAKNAPMTGARISLSDIGRPDHPLANQIQKKLVMAPGSLTEIKIEYPYKTSDLLPVTPEAITAATNNCIAEETAKLPTMKDLKLPEGTSEEQRATKIAARARRACGSIGGVCSSAPKKVMCQRRLRRYGPRM